jgi:hypothetical protein
MRAADNAKVDTELAAIVTAVGSGSASILNDINDGNNNRILILKHSAGNLYVLYIKEDGSAFHAETDAGAIRALQTA